MILIGFKINQTNVDSFVNTMSNNDIGPWITLLLFILKKLKIKSSEKIVFVVVGSIMSLSCMILLFILNS